MLCIFKAHICSYLISTMYLHIYRNFRSTVANRLGTDGKSWTKWFSKVKSFTIPHFCRFQRIACQYACTSKDLGIWNILRVIFFNNTKLIIRDEYCQKYPKHRALFKIRACRFYCIVCISFTKKGLEYWRDTFDVFHVNIIYRTK